LRMIPKAAESSLALERSGWRCISNAYHASDA
jgi:hypothetical protein